MIYCSYECVNKNQFGFCGLRGFPTIGPSGCSAYVQKSDSIYYKAINNFGVDAQNQKTVEELAELADAIMGHGCIVEETADVLNMIEQIKIMHGITNEVLGSMMAYKMGRTLQKIKLEE